MFDEFGKELIPFEYIYLCFCENNEVLITKKSAEGPKYGVIDIKGKEILPNIYYRIREYGSNYLWVTNYENVIILNDADVNIYYKRDKQYSLDNPCNRHNTAPEEQNCSYGLYDIKGKEILPISHLLKIDINQGITNFGFKLLLHESAISGLFAPECHFKGYAEAWFDNNGKQMCGFFQKVYLYCKGYARINHKSLYYFLKPYEKLEERHKGYLNTEDFNLNGYAKVKDVSSKKYGFIDVDLKVLIPCEYDDLMDFTEGLAAAKKGSYWGFIDEKNKVLIDFQYFYVRPIFNSLFVAIKKGKDKKGVVNLTNETIVPFEYDCINIDSEYIRVYIGDFYPDYQGIYSLEGKLLIEPIYKYLSFKSGLFVAKTDKKSILFNEQGVWLDEVIVNNHPSKYIEISPDKHYENHCIRFYSNSQRLMYYDTRTQTVEYLPKEAYSVSIVPSWDDDAVLETNEAEIYEIRCTNKINIYMDMFGNKFFDM